MAKRNRVEASVEKLPTDVEQKGKQRRANKENEGTEADPIIVLNIKKRYQEEVIVEGS
jgi:hypothetical protein